MHGVTGLRRCPYMQLYNYRDKIIFTNFHQNIGGKINAIKVSGT